MTTRETEDNKIHARYERIALDIAYSIYNNEHEEGSLIKGRSTLAGKYNVSPETIRRGMKLLEEMDVVEILDKVGIRIKSVHNALRFIQEYQSKNQILVQREKITELVEEREKINHQVLQMVDSIIEQSLSLRNIGIIYPLEYKLTAQSPIIGKKIGEIRFWDHTGATIIGINRGGKLYLSPGPNHTFAENDVVLYVGNIVKITEKVERFINKGL